MQFRLVQHESRADGAGLGTIHECEDVAFLSMSSACLQAVGHDFLANHVTLGAVLDTVLHRVDGLFCLIRLRCLFLLIYAPIWEFRVTCLTPANRARYAAGDLRSEPGLIRHLARLKTRRLAVVDNPFSCYPGLEYLNDLRLAYFRL